jgi:hypothetical protein
MLVVLAAAAITATGLLVAWIIALSREPVDGTDAVGMTMMSALLLAVLAGLASVVLVSAAIWLRVHNARQPAAAPAGWYADPGASSTWRYWDGQDWTSHTA